jgi:hypothetical protein
LIDLNTWNLTLPVGSPTVIETPALAGGYQDRYFQNLNGKLYFVAPVTGSTTKNAKYPRTELRETLRNGQLNNWTYPKAHNYLRAGLTMTQVPSVGKVVIGQIHAYNDTKPMLKVEYQYKHDKGTGNVVAKVRTSPGGTEVVHTLVQGIPLNQRLTYSIGLSAGGTLSVYVNKVNWSGKLNSAWKTKPLYFKAGVYVQDNSGPTTEVGAATFDKLEIEHKPK